MKNKILLASCIAIVLIAIISITYIPTKTISTEHINDGEIYNLIKTKYKDSTIIINTSNKNEKILEIHLNINKSTPIEEKNEFEKQCNEISNKIQYVDCSGLLFIMQLNSTDIAYIRTYTLYNNYFVFSNEFIEDNRYVDI